MARKEKQWEVEDKNLRTMGTENSRQIQIQIYNSHHFLRGLVSFYTSFYLYAGSKLNRVSLNSRVVAIPRSLNLGWNFLSSGFVLNLFHICFLGCRNLRLGEWGFEVTGRGFCCFARKLPSEVTSPFLPFIQPSRCLSMLPTPPIQNAFPHSTIMSIKENVWSHLSF